MFYSGVMVETRIYGELCTFVAVALVLIGERYITQIDTRVGKPKMQMSQHSVA